MNISALLQRIFLLRSKASAAQAQNTAFERVFVFWITAVVEEEYIPQGKAWKGLGR